MRNRGRLASLLLLSSLASAGLQANDPDSRLPELARAGDRVGVAVLLQEDGVDVEAAQVDGTTALHWVAYGGDVELAELLLDAGADPDAVNRNGSTPLALACANASPTVVARLLDAGANPGLAPTGEPPILTCARTGRVAAVRALLAHGADIDAVDAWRGQTPLMWAAAENHVPVMHVLLEAGAAVDAPSSGGFTALMFAVRQDARAAARLLVEAGAEVNVRMPDRAAQAAGRPPATGSLLSMAVTIGHFTAAAMLLDAGADPNARDGRGNAILHDLVRARAPQRRVANQFVDATGRDRSQLDGLELMRMLLQGGAEPNARTEPVPIVHERWTDKEIFSAGRPLMDNRVNLGGATPYVLAAQAADVEAMRVLGRPRRRPAAGDLRQQHRGDAGRRRRTRRGIAAVPIRAGRARGGQAWRWRRASTSTRATPTDRRRCTARSTGPRTVSSGAWSSPAPGRTSRTSWNGTPLISPSRGSTRWPA